MKRPLLMLLMGLMVSACGGANDDGAVQPVDELDTDVVDAETTPDIGTVDTDEPDVGEEPEDVELVDTADPTDLAEPDATEDDVWMEDAADVPTPDSAETTDPDVVEPPEEPDYVVCDAGHEAWVKRTIPILLGRQPTGIREVRVLAAMVEQTSREAVAKGLMERPEYITRWAAWLKDELRVNRVGDKMHASCYGDPVQPQDEGAIAQWVSEHAPDTTESIGAAFNMTDVLQSSLKLDDLTPFYRAHLFAMMPKPITGANVAALELDLTRRQDFGENFESIYLHRNVVCAGCHNSEFATTDSPDPELDRHWPLEGKFEKAVYGNSSGIKEMEVYSIFRHLGVVRSNGGTRPWKMLAACGRFESRTNIDSDPAEYNAHFTTDLGMTASIWDVEQALHEGVDSLRENGMLSVDPETLEVSGPEAFAYLVSMRIVNQVWREVMGYPLTLVHYFPRNEHQRDILGELTQHFVMEQWSLKTLLLDIVLHPTYNDNAAIDGCGDSAYYFPPIFNPWILDEPDEELHGNSVGDATFRYNARVMLNMLNTAMEWPASPDFPNAEQEVFQKAVGVFVKDAEPGFSGVDFQGMLTWENRYGACASQGSSGGSGDAGTCVGYCGGQAVGCYCDAECVGAGDCCPDYEAVCVNGEIPSSGSGDDWIGKLVTVAKLSMTDDVDDPDNITVRDVVASLKNRLLVEPDIDDTSEAALIATLFEVEDLDTPLASAEGWEDRLRRLCGVLVSTPQFLLAGNAPADQATTPRLEMNGSYQSICENYASAFYDPLVWTVTCSEDSVLITPYLPPLGGN